MAVVNFIDLETKQVWFKVDTRSNAEATSLNAMVSSPQETTHIIDKYQFVIEKVKRNWRMQVVEVYVYSSY